VTHPDVRPADPDLRPADLDLRPADLDLRPADPHRAADPDSIADPDSTAGTGPAAAAEVAPSGVVSTEDMPDAATPARPTDEMPEAEGQPALGDSLRAQVVGLDELDELPVADHIERYEALHDELHAALRGIHDPGG
jgi:hypothetical protein